MNNEDIDQLLASKPALRNARVKLEAMRDGAYCLHRSWGFGQIKGYDAPTGRLLIDFPESNKLKHPMAPEFCVDKLVVLAPNNILVRQKTEPDVVANLIKSDPAGLIKEILRTDASQSMSALELDGILVRLLGAAKAKKWWSTTKKLLVKDPDVAVPAKKDGQYVLREDPVKPEQEILEEYYLNKNPLKKIQLAEKLFEFSLSERSKTQGGNEDARREQVKFIETDLHRIFDELTAAIRSAKNLTKAECLHGIWVRNDLCRHLKEDVEQLEPTSKSIIVTCDEAGLSELAAEIPQTPAYLKRILDLLTRVYPEPEKWQETIIELLRNSTGKFTAECVNFLTERECSELVGLKLLEWLNAQALKGSVLSWIIKNRNSRKHAAIVRPLINHRLLAAILYAIDTEALLATSNRRITLAEELSDDKDLIPDLLEEANYEVARDLAQSLMLNQGFEPLTKKSILARFIKLYPGIQNLVAGDIAEQSEQLVVSQWSLDARKRELEDILKNKIPENKKAIATAKEHGDLKENSEYKMARQDQETLLARKANLEGDLTRGRVTDFTEATTETVGVGNIVDLLPGKGGKTVRYTILGAWDSAPEDNILSYKTPLAQKILGKKVGDTVQTEIDGNVETWTLRKIARWVEEKKK
ncbi:MAG: GreA/GreB family elongation factor [Puniceicoccales bacterium]|jgi:transcription elongation GreA/GreB family factor|nr:GreA/GreB family elongation factor [Puniceicoccales bacterium]